MENDLSKRFHERLLMTCVEARKLGYSPVRFEQMLRTDDGDRIAKRLIISGELQEGLKRLISMGRSDLSMESIMLEGEFEALFTPAELAAAKWRLNSAAE